MQAPGELVDQPWPFLRQAAAQDEGEGYYLTQAQEQRASQQQGCRGEQIHLGKMEGIHLGHLSLLTIGRAGRPMSLSVNAPKGLLKGSVADSEWVNGSQ